MVACYVVGAASPSLSCKVPVTQNHVLRVASAKFFCLSLSFQLIPTDSFTTKSHFILCFIVAHGMLVSPVNTMRVTNVRKMQLHWMTRLAWTSHNFAFDSTMDFNEQIHMLVGNPKSRWLLSNKKRQMVSSVGSVHKVICIFPPSLVSITNCTERQNRACQRLEKIQNC